MARRAGLRAFARDAVLTKDHERLHRAQLELEQRLAAHRTRELQHVGLREPERPRAAAHIERGGRRAGIPALAVEPLLMQKAPRLHIEQRHVREVDLHAAGAVRRAAEKRDLVAEAPSILGGEMAGDIPPLDLEFRMAAVIARKHKPPPRLRQREPLRRDRSLRRRGAGKEEKESREDGDAHHFTPPDRRANPRPTNPRPWPPRARQGARAQRAGAARARARRAAVSSRRSVC